MDVQNWEALEVYLRAQFEVDDSIKRIKLVVKVELDGEVKLRRVHAGQRALQHR